MLQYRSSRRDILKSSAVGFGYLAFAGLSTWAAEKENSCECSWKRNRSARS